jgi:hypothetical protein
LENKFSNIKERILYIAEYYGVNKEKFFADMGLTYGNFKGNNKTRPINSDAIEKILAIYSDVDPVWLITGAGSITGAAAAIVQEPPAAYIRKQDCSLCAEKERIIAILQDQLERCQKRLERLEGDGKGNALMAG